MSDALPENDAAVADFFKLMIDQGLTIVDVGAQNLSTEEHVYHRLVQHDLVAAIDTAAGRYGDPRTKYRSTNRAHWLLQ